MSVVLFAILWPCGVLLALAMVRLAVRLLTRLERFLERFLEPMAGGVWPFGPR